MSLSIRKKKIINKKINKQQISMRTHLVFLFQKKKKSFRLLQLSLSLRKNQRKENFFFFRKTIPTHRRER